MTTYWVKQRSLVDSPVKGLYEASDGSHGDLEVNELALCRPLEMLVPPPTVRSTESQCPTQMAASHPPSSNASVLVCACILRFEVVAFDTASAPHSLRCNSATMHFMKSRLRRSASAGPNVASVMCLRLDWFHMVVKVTEAWIPALYLLGNL